MSRAQAPQPLRRVLRRAQLRVAAIATGVVGGLLMLASAMLLRASAQNHLELVARSLAYTVDAAVVFRDARATTDILADVGRREHLAQAEIRLPGGRVLARYQPPPPEGLEDRLAALLPSFEVAQAVLADGQEQATLQVRAQARLLVQAAGWGLLGLLAGMASILLAVRRAARELAEQVEAPLLALAAQTRTIREAQDFDRRVPSARVTEIDALARDFNALLAQVQAQRQELMQRHVALQSAHDQLAHQSRLDGLTGIANRAWFEHCLAVAMTRPRPPGERLAVLFIDVNDFKRVNDEHGHEVGDQVLTALAGRLRGCVRESDLVARLGGDEFVVLIDPLRQREDIATLVHKLTSALAHPAELGSAARPLPGVSIGAAVFPDDGQSPEALLREADRQMYRRKPSTASRTRP
ncbi:diguanylate cyclase [Ideonella dechloratans]|uniref:Diguanylate cyclase n=1 Tax=Ideonella dechloratans TaxID=36863 RepID=A0A643FAT2_IDEDE|nr:sensor domain-containing diguanylate cyclase [Ideonella dechloratans]KAB0579357.1 diguanylate cyclase [Ideonella dechloratans]UFU09726.1 diguanylate cyclase [Ideonella dechloratans]